MGGLGDDDCPVRYINKEGKYGKIAVCFKAFLELVAVVLEDIDLDNWERLEK